MFPSCSVCKYVCVCVLRKMLFGIIICIGKYPVCLKKAIPGEKPKPTMKKGSVRRIFPLWSIWFWRPFHNAWKTFKDVAKTDPSHMGPNIPGAQTHLDILLHLFTWNFFTSTRNFNLSYWFRYMAPSHFCKSPPHTHTHRNSSPFEIFYSTWHCIGIFVDEDCPLPLQMDTFSTTYSLLGHLEI